MCIFDGPRKHVDLLGMNNYRTLATTQQYERRLMLIAASRGRQRERLQQKTKEVKFLCRHSRQKTLLIKKYKTCTVFLSSYRNHS